MSQYSELTTIVARVAFLKTRLVSQDAWTLRALGRIYDEQTADEQRIGGTHENNGVGFSGADGEILSSFAEQYKKKGRLSEKQMHILRGKMSKYASQLEKLVRLQQSEAA